MNWLCPPEVVPAPRGGWTAVRAGTDERGAFEGWIGRNFDEHGQARQAAEAWEASEPTNEEAES